MNDRKIQVGLLDRLNQVRCAQAPQVVDTFAKEHDMTATSNMEQDSVSRDSLIQKIIGHDYVLSVWLSKRDDRDPMRFFFVYSGWPFRTWKAHENNCQQQSLKISATT